MTYTKTRFKLSQAESDVAEALRNSPDQSETTIRCALNDRLDLASKEGFLVNFDFDQERAVARIKRMIQVGQDTRNQPKTGVRCYCKPGVQRDNCPECEGTGWVIDFVAIRNR